MAQFKFTKMSKNQLQFSPSHRPALDDGDYILTTTQSLSIDNQKQKITQSNDGNATNEIRFSVVGPRFNIDSNLIHSVFPPKGSLGEYSNILPHVIIDRSTLPWERRIDSSEDKKTSASWLALLLFSCDEMKNVDVKSMSLADLQADVSKSGTPQFPTFTFETSDQSGDLLNVIDVPKALLEAILPRKENIKLLSHVRISSEENSEYAIVLGNRLPQANTGSIVHLVSLENRTDLADFSKISADKIRLVSLFSWQFSTVTDDATFQALCDNLDLKNFQLPSEGKTNAKPYLDQGFVALKHQTRQGNNLASWFRGPCITGNNFDSISTPVGSSDELTRYWSNLQMFDVSYSAAWEIGRMLTLQNKKVSVDLLNWKRQRRAANQSVPSHLHFSAPIASFVPYSVESWFQDLVQLRHLPFHYLVQQDQMLPQESLRFFMIDSAWLDALIDGAYSIGRVTSGDQKFDAKNEDLIKSSLQKPISGIFLRSSLVSGWKNFNISINSGTATNIIRRDNLGDNMMICLFDQAISEITFQEKHEAIHCGVDGDATKGFSKALRDPKSGKASGQTLSNFQWQNSDQQKLVIDFYESFKTNFAPFIESSTTFAVSMIEGVSSVTFKKNNS